MPSVYPLQDVDPLDPRGPIHDPQRLAILRQLGLLETPAEEAFDRLTRLARLSLHVPVAIVNLVEDDRQFLKSSVGLPQTIQERREVPVTYGLCPYVVAAGTSLFVDDVRAHPTLCTNPAVADFDIGSYAGVPLTTADGYIVGTFCVIDTATRVWTGDEREVLRDLAASAMTEIELRRSAAEVRASEEQFRSLSRCSPVGIVLTDTSGHATYTNASCQHICGFTFEEALGTGWARFVHPDDRDRAMDGWTRSAQAGLPWSEELRFVHPDGTVRWAISRFAPLYSDAEVLLGHVGTIEDITARRQAEEELATQHADLVRLHDVSIRLSTSLALPELLTEVLSTVTALQETTMGVVMLYDRERDDLYTEASLGLSDAYLEQVGRVPRGVGACGTAIDQGQRVIVEDVESDPLFVPYRAAGRLAGYRAVYSVPLLTRQGEILGTLATYFAQPHRPTEREMRLVELYARQAGWAIDNARLYRDARAAITARDEFLAAASHDLKTPLTVIKGATQMLQRLTQRGGAAPERMAQITDSVLTATTQMMEQIDDLLDVARLDVGQELAL